MQKKLKICLATTFVFGLILLILGLVLGFVLFPSEVEKQVKDNVVLKYGTEQWDRFVELPIPLNFKLHFFEVANKDDFLAGNKANLIERGPYAYTEKRTKKHLMYEGNDLLAYDEYQYFEFNADMSKGEESDEIQFLNVPYIATLQLIEGLAANIPFINFEKNVFPQMFTNTDVFLKATVRTLLFDGIKLCEKSKIKSIARLLCMVIRIMDLKNIKTTPDYQLFSLLEFKNNHSSGQWMVNTGIKDYEQLGEIVAWNDQNQTNYWEGECNQVKGRDSTVYPPLFDKDAVFDIFSLDICRTARMVYKQDSTYKDIDGYRYEATEDLYKSDNPEQSCYCIKMSQNEKGEPSCFLDGVLDLFTCYGAPLLASNPHFFEADKRYREMVNGLSPNKEKHNSYADLEPNTGTPLRGAKRIQLNMVVRKYTLNKVIENTKLIHGAVLPLVWIEEGTELTDEYIDKLNSMYFDVLVLLEAVKWTLTAIGLAIILFSTFFSIYKYRS